jgi:transposase
MLRGRLLQRSKKRGACVGKTKRGKGSKVMAIADRSSLPIAIGMASASPHEVTLVEETLDHAFAPGLPEKLVGDKAYDSDPLDQALQENWGVELIAPHRRDRRHATQDGRALRRYRRRWKVERLFAWLHNFRRLVVRYEYHAKNFLGMLQLGCAIILLRNF